MALHKDSSTPLLSIQEKMKYMDEMLDRKFESKVSGKRKNLSKVIKTMIYLAQADAEIKL